MKKFSTEKQENCLSCGVCKEGNVVNFCIDCKHHLCSFCTSIHQKFPLMKNHVLTSVVPFFIKSEVEIYCKSCDTAIDCSEISRHGSCQTVNISEFKQNLYEALIQSIDGANHSIHAIKGNLNFIGVKMSSVANDADSLKRQVHKHCDKVKRCFSLHVQNICNDLEKDIEKECSVVKDNLELPKSDLLELEKKLEDEIDDYKKMVQQLNKETVIKAIKSDFLKVLEDGGKSLKNQHVSANCFSKKFNLSFHSNKHLDEIFKKNNFIGCIKKGKDVHPGLLKSLKVYPTRIVSEIKGTNLYHAMDRDGVLVVQKHCSSKYDYLSSINLQLSTRLQSVRIRKKQFQFHTSFMLAEDFLCALVNPDLLEVYDLRKDKGNPGWKNSIPLFRDGIKLLPSKGRQIFITSSEKVVGITLDGRRVNAITGNLVKKSISSIVELFEDRFAITVSDELHIVNSGGHIVETFNKGSLADFRLEKPNQLVLDNNSNLYVSDHCHTKVGILDFKLNLVKFFDAQCIPRQLCFDSTRDRLLVFGERQLNVFQL